MKTIIIDDEELAIKGLSNLLRQYDDFFEVIEIAKNGREALEKIRLHQPDVIFLDIEMPVYNGFEVLKQLTIMPLVVFTTAYDAFAVKAFEENSVDYILKPIEKERFDLTVPRLKQLNKENKNDLDIRIVQKLLEKLDQKQEVNAITVKTGDRILFIPVSEITHFFAEDRYVLLNTIASIQHLTTYSIQSLEEILPKNFIRVSRSSIINTNHILEARKSFGGNLVIHMKDQKKTKIETGRKYIDNFKKVFDL